MRIGAGKIEQKMPAAYKLISYAELSQNFQRIFKGSNSMRIGAKFPNLIKVMGSEDFGKNDKVRGHASSSYFIGLCKLTKKLLVDAGDSRMES